MTAHKFQSHKTYVITDKEKTNEYKISVLPRSEDTYCIHWHEENFSQFCSQPYFDARYDLVKELPPEKIKLKFTK